MIQHMRITDRGNEILSDSPPGRGRDTMMFVILKGIVSGRTLGGLGVGKQRYFEYIWQTASHWGSSSGEKRKIFGAKNLLIYISYIVCLNTRICRRMGWIDVGCNIHRAFEHKDLQTNAFHCCWLQRQIYYRNSITCSSKKKKSYSSKRLVCQLNVDSRHVERRLIHIFCKLTTKTALHYCCWVTRDVIT